MPAINRLTEAMSKHAKDFQEYKATNKKEHNKKTIMKTNPRVQIPCEGNIGMVKAKVNGKDSIVLLDTSSTHSGTSLRIAEEFGISVKPFQRSVSCINSTVTLCGSGTCLLKIMDIEKKVELAFLDSDHPLLSQCHFLIGSKALKCFPPMTFDFNKNIVSFLNELSLQNDETIETNSEEQVEQQK